MSRIRGVSRWLADLELWVMALLVGASLISARWLLPAVCVGLLFWLVRWAATGRASVRTAADWGILGLIVMIPVTLLVSAYPELSRPQVLRLAEGILFYYAIANWAGRERRLRWAAVLAMGACLVLAASALVSVEWPQKLPIFPASLYALFPVRVADSVNPNVMAGALVILLPLSLGLILFGWRQMTWYEKLAGVSSAVLGGIILVLTQSRGAWLGLGGALAVLVALRWRGGWMLVGGAAIALLGIAAIYGFPRAAEAIALNPTLGGLAGRLEVWSRAVYMLQDFPFSGVGMGAYLKVADEIYPFFLMEPGKVEHAHQLLLQVGVDLGIPGLISWLAVLGGATACAYKAWRANGAFKPGWMAGLGAGLLASQAALVLHGSLDAVTWGMVRSAPLVWLGWGVAAAAGNLAARQELADRHGELQ